MERQSICEDIQALKERFRAEFGLNVLIDIHIHATRNETKDYQPARKAVDIISRGGFEGYDAVLKEGGRARWVELEHPDGNPRLALYYPSGYRG